jgi:hypothetical protein
MIFEVENSLCSEDGDGFGDGYGFGSGNGSGDEQGNYIEN